MERLGDYGRSAPKDDGLLRNILVLSVKAPVMFFGSVLNRGRIWNFSIPFGGKCCISFGLN
jgi:hypothetical protein